MALALTACGDGDSDKGSASDKPVVGIILPDSKSSGRWEGQDRPALDAAFRNAGVKVDIQNAENDAAKMQTIADQMISKGIKVLAIVNLDSASGAAIQAKAKTAGVKTI
ncbi:MAG: substrate-binding domain-containing protein, partial [Angustibacter sp.]